MKDRKMANDTPEDLDRQVLQMLADDGNDLAQPMTIEFTIAAASEDQAHAVADACDDSNFEIHVYFHDGMMEDPEESDPPSWKCICKKDMVPDFDVLQEIQASLSEKAEKFEAELEGWGTFGNAKP